MWVHQDQHQWKICSEDPIMVKQVVSGCPEEENKSEMKSNQVQSCSMGSIYALHQLEYILNKFFHRSHLNKVRGDAVCGAAFDKLALRRQEVFRVGIAELLPERAH